MSISILLNVCPPGFTQAPDQDIVRLIYFRPNDLEPQADIDETMDTMIKEVQQFYADQMYAHGYGRKTFTFEADESGKAIVHHINGKFAEEHYNFESIETEIEEQFDVSQNIYFIVIEGDYRVIGICGLSQVHGGQRGLVLVSTLKPPCFYPFVAAHELGHVFGLQHDFRDEDDIYVMSYGGRHWNNNKLSKCAAEWLNVNRFFNRGTTYANKRATIELISAVSYPSDAIVLRFDVMDSDRLHQAQLGVPATADEPAPGWPKLYDCKSLNGESSEVEFFVSDPDAVIGNEVRLQIIDVLGNITRWKDVIEKHDLEPLQIDVNADGSVNILDLVLIAGYFEQADSGRDISDVDVNRDGVINVNDLILVANAMNK